MGFRLSKFGHLKQKTSRKLLRKLGVSGKSKWIRQFKKRYHKAKDAVSSSYQQPTSATTVGYQYEGKTLSQLTGGV